MSSGHIGLSAEICWQNAPCAATMAIRLALCYISALHMACMQQMQGHTSKRLQRATASCLLAASKADWASAASWLPESACLEDSNSSRACLALSSAASASTVKVLISEDKRAASL